MTLISGSSAYKNLRRAKKVNLFAKRGDTFSAELPEVTDSNGDPYDFTSERLVCHIKSSKDDKYPVAFPVIAGDALGIVTMTMPAEVTRELAVGKYFYDIELYNSSSENFTLFEGEIIFELDITLYQDVDVEIIEYLISNDWEFQRQPQNILSQAFSNDFKLEKWGSKDIQSLSLDNEVLFENMNTIVDILHVPLGNDFLFLVTIEDEAALAMGNDILLEPL